MIRRSTISNDDLRVHLDGYGQVCQLFLPSSRPVSYAGDNGHKIGVRVDGVTSWVDDGRWTVRVKHAYNAPVSSVVLVNEYLGVLLELEDLVAQNDNILIRNIHIVNLGEQQRRINLFLHQSFAIDSPNGPDTAQFIPKDRAVLHYGSGQAFVASGATDVGHRPDQHSIGIYGNGLDGTWRDGDDGELAGDNVVNGQTDSTLRFSLTIGALSSRRVYYWLSSAESAREAIELQRSVTLSFLANELEDTVKWWRKWLSPTFRMAEHLQPRYRQALSKSLSLLRQDQDLSGLVLHDQALAYSSVSDTTYAVWPLIRLGYTDEPSRFFAFCRSVMDDEGFLMVSYDARGSYGPSSHPYGNEQPPVQSDVTAIVLFVFSQFYAKHRQTDMLNENYSSFVVPMAEFLADFTDENNLPNPISSMEGDSPEVETYSVAVSYAALMAAADMAELMDDQAGAVAWRNAAEEMQVAFDELLVEGGIIKGSLIESKPSISDFFGAFMFGLVGADSDVAQATVSYLEQVLRRDDGLFGSVANNHEIDHLASLRMAQYYLEANRKDEAHRILRSIIDKSDAYSSLPTVVHAEIVSTLLDTINRA